MSYLEFTWPLETDPTGEERLRVLTAQFGDGYKQTAGDGINNLVQSWPLQFTGSAAYITEIRDFLRSHGGAKPFLWTPPLGVQGLYDAVDVKVQARGKDWYVLSTTFSQRFAP